MSIGAYLVIFGLVIYIAYSGHKRSEELTRERENMRRWEHDKERIDSLNQQIERNKKRHEKICFLSNTMNISYKTAESFFNYLCDKKAYNEFFYTKVDERRKELYREFSDYYERYFSYDDEDYAFYDEDDEIE